MLSQQELDASARGLLTVPVGTWKDPTRTSILMEEDTSADLGSLEDNGDKVTRLYKKTRKALPITKKVQRLKKQKHNQRNNKRRPGQGWGFLFGASGLGLRA